MNDEMLYARIAYIIPFQKGPGASREPVLLIRAKQHEEIAFDISLFFIILANCKQSTICLSKSAFFEIKLIFLFQNNNKFLYSSIFSFVSRETSKFIIWF